MISGTCSDILIQNAERVLSSLKSLRAEGVQISIDDFDTGYSSLSYLPRMDADKVKIDQSFVRNLASSSEDVAIVRAIIQMAHGLNLVVVAEGVETQDVLQVLKDLQCDTAQGYFFARPNIPQEIIGSFSEPFDVQSSAQAGIALS